MSEEKCIYILELRNIISEDTTSIVSVISAFTGVDEIHSWIKQNGQDYINDLDIQLNPNLIYFAYKVSINSAALDENEMFVFDIFGTNLSK